MARFYALLATGALFLFSACQNGMNSSPPKRDINAVIAAHSSELMALPGVVGVYLGLMPDEKTQCIKVMLKELNAPGAGKIPKTLQGYPVLTEVTGQIKPLK
jgi:hypothetical protein